MSDPRISVVICTHNRDMYLGDAIDSLSTQVFPDFEIVVVDNASTDRTREVVEARIPDNPRLRYVHEPVLGLNVARNRGVQETQAPIIAYFDDDAIATPQWLQTLWDAFSANDKLGVAGGKVTLIWPEGFSEPSWLSPGLAGNLGAYDLGPEVRAITDPGQTPRGLNYAIRRRAFEDVGSFSPNLDRVGKNLLSNGELFMTELVLKAGWQVAYLPAAHVKHRVSPDRTTRAWFFQRGWWQGISEYNRELLAQRTGPGQLRRGGERIVRGLYKSLKYMGDPAQQFDNLVYAYGQIGYLSAVIKGLVFGPKLAKRS